MKTIICVVGASGAGKTSICLDMERRHGVPVVVSYTTRPMRPGEVDGVDHFFVGGDDVPPQDSMLAYTVFGGNMYWTLRSQIDDSPHDAVTYVVDEDGVRFFEERYAGVYRVVKVKVRRSDVSGVDIERRSRDEGRTEFGDDAYDIIIDNDSTVEDASDRLADALSRI